MAAGSAPAGFHDYNKAKYASQARLFLNAFWAEHSGQAEEIYQFHNGWIETDLHLKGLRPPNPAAEGTELEEHGFHYFLEKKIEPLTILQARANLREADVSKDGKISFLEFLLWRYKKAAADMCRRKPVDPMGADDPSKLTPAMRAAKAALNEVRAEIQKIETERYRLEGLIDEGGVKGVRAKNELAQLCSRDQTDLNRALLTAEAACRKAGAGTSDMPPSSLWWMNRELEEMKKFRPQSKK